MATSTSRQRGRSGGRRVTRTFSFHQGPTGAWPDEAGRRFVEVTPPHRQPSWIWALKFLDAHDEVWLRVPVKGEHGSAEWWSEKNSLRSTLWSTAKRDDIQLESLEYDGALWFRAR